MSEKILPKIIIKQYILMINPFGNPYNMKGGIIIGILMKIGIGMLIWTIISWYLAFNILIMVYS